MCWTQHRGNLKSYLLTFIHSIGMCRMWWFLAILRSFFHSFLLYTLSFHPFPPTSLPSSLTSFCPLFLGLPLSFISKFKYTTFLGILLPSILCACPNQCNLFNPAVSTIVRFLTIAQISLLVTFCNFLFHCHILGLKLFYTLSFQKCLFAFYLSSLVSRFLMHIFKALSIIAFFSLNFSHTNVIKLIILELKTLWTNLTFIQSFSTQPQIIYRMDRSFR